MSCGYLLVEYVTAKTVSETSDFVRSYDFHGDFSWPARDVFMAPEMNCSNDYDNFFSKFFEHCFLS